MGAWAGGGPAGGEFEPGGDHSAVAGAGGPADGLRLERGDGCAAAGERACGGEAGKAGADYGDVDALREFVRSRRWDVDGFEPEVFEPDSSFVNGHGIG